jgi:hypothetical protein
MKRSLMWVLAALAAAGCKAPAPTVDPFLGRQTVIPPRPGEVVATLPDQSYYPTSPAAPATARQSLVPRVAPPPASPSPVSITRTGSPAAAQPPAGRPTPSAAAPAATPAAKPLRSASPEETPPAASGRSALVSPVAAGTLRGTPTRVAAPILAGQPTPAEPRRFVADPAASDLSAWRGTAVSPASHQTPATGSDAWSAAPGASRAGASGTDSRGKYSYDPAYQTLEGRLEYSAAARRWKLRYIPLDGQTDDYGGSVVLLETPLLDAFRPGDFVAVTGKVSGEESGSKAFSPFYQIERIERVP